MTRVRIHRPQQRAELAHEQWRLIHTGCTGLKRQHIQALFIELCERRQRFGTQPRVCFPRAFLLQLFRHRLALHRHSRYSLFGLLFPEAAMVSRFRAKCMPRIWENLGDYIRDKPT